MEPIIRNPAVAPEARQLRRPHAEAATHGVQSPARETAFINRETKPAFTEERMSAETQGKPAVSNEAAPVDEAEELRRRFEYEKALADAQVIAEKRGYAAGLERGEEEATKAVAEQAERLSSVMASLYRAKADAIEDSEDEIVEIVYASVCKIIGETAFTPDVVAGIVKQVVALSRDRDQLTVRLHPRDFELVRKTLSQADGAIAEKPVNLMPDAAIELGGCIVEGATGSLDARLELQMELLRQTLMEARNNRERNEEAV